MKIKILMQLKEREVQNRKFDKTKKLKPITHSPVVKE
jgi:hypothetical protein